jgi:hypothetical protein
MSTTQTVSKTTTATTDEAKVKSHKDDLTDWSVFDEIGLVPHFKCDGYLGSHPADLSCHSKLLTDIHILLRHIDPQHGGGWFRVRFRKTDSNKPIAIWKEMAEQGVELRDFYCPHCRTQLHADKISSAELKYHLNPHPGANRVNLEPQTLCMTLTAARWPQDMQEEETIRF